MGRSHGCDQNTVDLSPGDGRRSGDQGGIRLADGGVAEDSETDAANVTLVQDLRRDDLHGNRSADLGCRGDGVVR